MKTLGVVQFQQKTFKILPIEGKWKATLGNIPAHFMMIIYGDSGNGKTELCIQLAKYLTQFGKVQWLSYEQGHGFDLQTAINRNKMQEVSGNFLVSDPIADLDANVSFREDLDNMLKKRNSADFVFIDSLDYTQFNWEDYDFLKKKYGNKKTFIWISHAKGKKPLKRIGEQIMYDGGIGIYIKDFIAHVTKNRFGGFEPYVIYEEKARQLNPLFFIPKVAEQGQKPEKKPKIAKLTIEAQGVCA
ncbi:MAG: hypothetical protein H7289_07740 [Mucilaginibacter sp.]|nr:hypothetical protein [Mucilaginibacter sp.]